MPFSVQMQCNTPQTPVVMNQIMLIGAASLEMLSQSILFFKEQLCLSYTHEKDARDHRLCVEGFLH